MVRHRQSWVMVAAAGLVIVAASQQPAAAQSTDEVAAQVRDCANQERAKRGLRTLVQNHILDQAAQLHARNMARYDFVGHTDPWGRGPGERVDRFGSADAFHVIAENVAAGQSSVAQACAEWMRSSGHRSSILDPTFRSVGGGFAMGQTGDRYYYVQEFGRTNPGGPSRENPRPRPRGPRVVMRLSQAGDVLTLRVDGRQVAIARRGQTVDVPLGRIRPRARITVEARSVSGDLSWGIKQRSEGRTVYSDARPANPSPTTPVIDLATGTAPLIHRVTLDARGHVLRSFTSRLPKPNPWARAGLVGRFR